MIITLQLKKDIKKATGKMMKILLPLLFTFLVQFATAQDSWISYNRSIPIVKYAGHRFKLQAYIKTAIAEDSAAARLWVQVRKTNGTGFFANMWETPVRGHDWKTYSITGTLDTGAVTLAFGTICQYNGLFYFDDIEVSVETAENQWQVLFVDKFEDKLKGWAFGIDQAADGYKPVFTARLSKGGAAKGQGALLIEGRGVPNYGNNKTAGKYAAVNGIRLYYETYGKGRPLLVLHGNGGSISNGGTFYRELAKKYKVIAVDSRAQGKSTDTEAPLTYDQMASDINELLNQLNIDSAFIWGQSDGAILGLLLAMDYPGKVRRVLAFGANIQPDSLALFPWAIEASKKIVDSSSDPKERKLNRLMLDYPNIPYEKLGVIKAPVLVMSGDRDVIRPEHTLKIFQHIPNSQMCIVPGATHGASWEKKDFFLKTLNEFFNGPFTMPNTKDWFQ